MKRKHLTLFNNRSLSVPSTLTDALISKVHALPDCPKGLYLKEHWMTKYVSSETDAPLTRRTRAINKWLATERNNEATNDRLLTTPDGFHILPRVKFVDFVAFCRSVISDIVGDVPPDDVLIGSFSGGASTSRTRLKSHPAFKFVGEADITSSAVYLFESIRADMPGWNTSELETRIVPGNVLFTVPKKTDIDRCACKEPDLNMFMQKGCGAFIRRRLKSVGINLNDQSVNQRLAHDGSLYGQLATLDLSSASDSVTTELVALLLPDLWFTLLNALRSAVTVIDGIEHRNEMFSSMGNGFTFEMESLLFYALMRTTAYFRGISGRISVYGDDIIIPHTLAHDAIWVLNYFGFEVNSSKSFIEGPFRESCGGHYLNGRDVTPFYLRKPIETVIDVIHVANGLRKWAIMDGIEILDSAVYPIWSWLKSYVPEDLWGGRDLSDTSCLVTPDETRKRLIAVRTRKATGVGGYYHWLNATWQRTSPSDAVVASERSIERQLYRKGRVRNPVTFVRHLFLEEVM